MIKIIDGEFRFFDEFKDFCKRDSFGTRIYSHYMCYRYEFNFVDFWVQFSSENKITAAFCRLDGDFVVSLSDEVDFYEISAFLNFQDKLSVTFDEKYSDALKLNFKTKSKGDVLLYKGNNYTAVSYDLTCPEIKDYHNLLLTCESDDFFVPDYMTFLSDISRRKQRQMCDIYGIINYGVLVSSAMTVSYTDFSVILGAVATHPMHRNQGYAGCIVKALAEKHKHLSSVYIYTTISKNTEFYKALGFAVTGKWIKYTMEASFE